VKDGNFRELCPLSRTYSQRGDVTQALAGASADSSPDGRFIAFSDGPPDGSRDIYSISKDGSSKEPLTDHPADDKEPRWSPDGRFVVFLSDRHGSWALWGIEVGDGHPEGDPFMVLEGDTELASWTKKGLVTRTSVAIRDIYTLEIDPQSLEARGKPRILDFTPSGSSFRPLFSPDGKHLAFTKFPLPTEKFPPSFFVKPSEGGEARQYENPARIWQWLPDSSGLCFLGVDEEKRPLFKRLEVDSGEWETASIPGTGLPQPTAPSVVFSSDGKTIFYTKMGKNRSDRGILAYSLETGQERSLYHTQTDDPQYLSLDASNDHKRLITGLWGRILILDADTGESERLDYPKENLSFPAWGPDGGHFAAAGRTTEDGGFNEIFIVSLADKEVKSLDVSRHFPPGMRILFTLDWSPDGKTIAYDTFRIISETNLIQNIIPKK
jgi:Tol biopolymer transport system component